MIYPPVTARLKKSFTTSLPPVPGSQRLRQVHSMQKAIGDIPETQLYDSVDPGRGCACICAKQVGNFRVS